MISMKLTPAEAKESLLCGPCDPSDAPKYPYGLSIQLDDETLAKLGIKDLPSVGTMVTITARCEVTRQEVSERQGEAGESEQHKSMGLQITDMDYKAGGAGFYPNSSMKNDAT